MAKETPTFEDNMNHLEQIVNQLENGDVPLEKALSEFKKGVGLSNRLQKTLSQAEHTLTHMETDDDKEVNFNQHSNDDQQNESDKQ
ncbi:exodeoxyribonuclease 7 small subunit [Philodulcilactobacillus myokoensis]|uniref:Exodeoxyribonuclease 7 small subunit n=1 Tax=Philodulcilactobacillus myokoensis TaxID=2929573 RepID=A0A9W6B0P9_9LACO|nr:exodeoxyribonuclease VII small subunit [Philodulcilactobacillus myokoensis]GLB46802.1 exodeoxyribonuclease 7 small subunit [Philodulcilactobacillus myokoensis]